MVALAIIVVSVRSAARAFSLLQIALAIPTVLIATWSLMILERIFFDQAWPTFLPFLTLAAVVPLAAIQWRSARRHRSNFNGTTIFVLGAVLVAVSATPLVLTAREIVMKNAAAARYSTQHIESRERGMAGGALRASLGGHVVMLQDDLPLNEAEDVRVEGAVRILIDGKDYSANSQAVIRLNSRDANRYWGYVYLMRLVDRIERTQQLAVAQNLVNGRFRTVILSEDGSVVADEFNYNERCDPPVRAILIDHVVGSPSGLCSDGREGWASVFYPVVYPWISCALGLSCLADAASIRRRRVSASLR